MSWVEVDGARWRRMHGLAIPVGESWVEVERSQVEVVAVEQGGGEWGWVEVDVPGWRWVYGLAIPYYIQKKQYSLQLSQALICCGINKVSNKRAIHM